MDSNKDEKHMEKDLSDKEEDLIYSIKKLLHSEDRKTRLAGVWALSQIFSQVNRIHELFEILSDELSHPNVTIRNAAIMTIWLAAKTQEKRKMILDDIIQMIASDNALLRRSGTILIMMLYRESDLEDLVIDKLLGLAKDQRMYVRNTAISTLLSFAEENHLEQKVLEMLINEFNKTIDEEILKTLSFGIIHLLERLKDEKILVKTLSHLIDSLSSPIYGKVLQTIVLISMIIDKFKAEKILMKLLRDIVAKRKSDEKLVRGISLLISSQFRGRGIPELLEIAKIMITSENAKIREAGIAMLTSVFKGSHQEEKALEMLKEIITSVPDKNVRVGALVGITELYRDSSKEFIAADLLMDFIKKGDDELKIMAAVAMGELFKKHKNYETIQRILKRLVQFLQTGDPSLHYASILAISILLEGTGDIRYLKILSKLLKSEDENIRYLTALSLGIIFKKNMREEVLNLLTPLVDDPCWLVREALAYILSEISDRRLLKQVKKILEKLLNDPVESVRIIASIALAKIYHVMGNEKKSQEIISNLLNSADWRTRIMAIQMIGDIFDNVNLILSYLKKASKDPEPLVKLAVIDTISNLVSRGLRKDAIEILKQLTYDNDWRISNAAIMTLADILARFEKEDEIWSLLSADKLTDEMFIRNFTEALAYILIHGNKPETIIRKLREMIFSSNKKENYFALIVISDLMKLISDTKLRADLRTLIEYIKQNAEKEIQNLLIQKEVEENILFT